MGSVFLLREMPDWERLKPAPANEPHRRWFYSHWGLENAVISGTDRNVEYTPFLQRLSIKVVHGGRERYFIDGRSIAVDDDCYLILNDSAHAVEAFEDLLTIDAGYQLKHDDGSPKIRTFFDDVKRKFVPGTKRMAR